MFRRLRAEQVLNLDRTRRLKCKVTFPKPKRVRAVFRFQPQTTGTTIHPGQSFEPDFHGLSVNDELRPGGATGTASK